MRYFTAKEQIGLAWTSYSVPPNLRSRCCNRCRLPGRSGRWPRCGLKTGCRSGLPGSGSTSRYRPARPAPITTTSTRGFANSPFMGCSGIGLSPSLVFWNAITTREQYPGSLLKLDGVEVAHGPGFAGSAGQDDHGKPGQQQIKPDKHADGPGSG